MKKKCNPMRQQLTNPEEFEYEFYRNGIKYSKKLKDMTDEELHKIYRSKSGISFRYEKEIQHYQTKISKAQKEQKSLTKNRDYITRKNSILLDVLDKVISVAESRGLDVEERAKVKA